MNVKLMTPGPTELLEDARIAMSRPIIHHRTEEFRAIVKDCRAGLKSYFRTSQDVVILTASGTGGMEASFVNLLSPGDKVLVGSCGKFGDRWTDLARAYGVEAEVMRTPTGEALDPEAVARRLRELGPKAFFLTANETSVAVRNDLPALMKAVASSSPETLVVTDAITAVGAFPYESEAWGIDVVVGSSQKALSLPPGLAFVTMSPRARQAMTSGRLPKFYFDLPRELDKQAGGDIGFTPAITLVVGLQAALAYFLGRTLESVWAETSRRAQATRAGLQALGVGLVAKGAAVSDAVTAGYVPQGLDGAKLLKDLEAVHRIKIAGGQNELKGKIFRISHFGPVTDADTLACLAGLEDLLHKAGKAGATQVAAAAAQRALEVRA